MNIHEMHALVDYIAKTIWHPSFNKYSDCYDQRITLEEQQVITAHKMVDILFPFQPLDMTISFDTCDSQIHFSFRFASDDEGVRHSFYI